MTIFHSNSGGGCPPSWFYEDDNKNPKRTKNTMKYIFLVINIFFFTVLSIKVTQINDKLDTLNEALEVSWHDQQVEMYSVRRSEDD